MGWTLAVHGGAGLIERHVLDAERELQCRVALGEALDAGARVLAADGDALDAVAAAVRVLEDSPLFNAGRGAVFAADGVQRFDASVMRGVDRAAGAIAAVEGLRHPVDVARRVLERTRHVLLVGPHARAFAEAEGAELAEAAWLFVQERWDQLERARAADVIALDHELEDPRTGTVGAVARDARGHLAAATSTGGMTNKHPGRVGDSALIGAGTWADDATCAVSATGHGELFIRAHVAGRVADLMELAGLSVAAACDRVVHDELPRLGGRGGVIAVDRDGRLALPFNSGGMYRGWARADGEREVAIW